MGRASLNWQENETEAITRAISNAHRTQPTDNEQFLGEVISKIAEVTGRVYGQSTYDRLIRAALGVNGTKRRPSAPTIQRAIERYREANQEIVGTRSTRLPSPPGNEIGAALPPAVRQLLDSLLARSDEDNKAIRHALEALAEAHARVASLECENAQLREALVAAQPKHGAKAEHPKPR
ncbi:hypothetical protein PQQ51_11665 [Paraburkholderia xenovorans]|uniref:hypothetical protein n=1 Tax=Paraburkholderia xenovorans TaxID=36873 RepID=UPI0038B6FA70